MTHQLFSDLIKAEPAAADVHVTTALGNGKVRAIRERLRALEERNPGVTEKVREIMLDSFGYDVDTGVLKQVQKRTASPFPHDPNFLARLRKAQVPSFLRALTHRGEIPKARVKLDELVAIQDRVNPRRVAARLGNPGRRPTVVKLGDQLYIADGHDRLSARVLAGKTHANVRLHDIDHPADPAALKKWEIPFEVKKADPDQRMIFGWASVVTKNGRLVVDSQNDVIAPEVLEKAFYDYVLYARDQGHMHSQMGVGRLIECMMFTKQKQDVLKIVIKDEDGDQIEGAWVGYYVDDDAVWDAHKKGALPAFSIGGAAVPIEVEV